ncbi:MAG: KamA family radical SAM protein, partial [Desulfohalobiaceae bacterium]
MNKQISISELDGFSQELFQELSSPVEDRTQPSQQEQQKTQYLLHKARQEDLTQPIVDLFQLLLELRRSKGLSPQDLGLEPTELLQLAQKHQELDEHLVSIGGRVLKALPIVQEAEARAADYQQKHPVQAPSGIELWDRVQENQQRIKQVLGMQDQDWDSFTGQMQFAIESVETLSKILDLPQEAVQDIQR